MILSVTERLLLLNSLPEAGDITTIRIVRKLREDLSFSEEEHKILDIKVDQNRITWNQEKAKNYQKDVILGEKAMDIIKQSLQDMSNRKLLHESHIPIWERFVEAGAKA